MFLILLNIIQLCLTKSPPATHSYLILYGDSHFPAISSIHLIYFFNKIRSYAYWTTGYKDFVLASIKTQVL